MEILNSRKPDFTNLQKVLKCERPNRPTLFELFMNDTLYQVLAGRKRPNGGDELEYLRFVVDAFAGAGYDYATTYGSKFKFIEGQHKDKETISLNASEIISDEKSFEEFKWENPEDYDYSKLENIEGYLPDGMKLAIMGPGGVLENVISLTGYDNLCFMLYDNPALLKQIFDNVGERLVKYYERAAQYDSVGLIISNDDWGFNTQTFLSPRAMNEYVYPWHKKIVEAAHRYNKPIILHSCGYYIDSMEIIIDDLNYDGKHSFEDNILRVEESYDRWKGRIAILGGIDVDFMIEASDEDIKRRSHQMIEKSLEMGGYALGTGNSVPEYIPIEKYLAMISAIHDVY